MKCPICRKEVNFGSPYMPFCSERCKLIDLGNWASEKYVISTSVTTADESDVNGETKGEKNEDEE
jgi:endogenous inhibitor of DNA gyrase (YacG/DUF329 family)